MLRKYRSRRRPTRFTNRRGCYFCAEKMTEVSAKDATVLLRFLSPRGKIIARSRSGVCARHQRKLSKAIKKARINALLPFKENTIS